MRLWTLFCMTVLKNIEENTCQSRNFSTFQKCKSWTTLIRLINTLFFILMTNRSNHIIRLQWNCIFFLKGKRQLLFEIFTELYKQRNAINLTFRRLHKLVFVSEWYSTLEKNLQWMYVVSLFSHQPVCNGMWSPCVVSF